MSWADQLGVRADSEFFPNGVDEVLFGPHRIECLRLLLPVFALMVLGDVSLYLLFFESVALVNSLRQK